MTITTTTTAHYHQDSPAQSQIFPQIIYILLPFNIPFSKTLFIPFIAFPILHSSATAGLLDKSTQ